MKHIVSRMGEYVMSQDTEMGKVTITNIGKIPVYVTQLSLGYQYKIARIIMRILGKYGRLDLGLTREGTNDEAKGALK